jgi:hypothetical protein
MSNLYILENFPRLVYNEEESLLNYFLEKNNYEKIKNTKWSNKVEKIFIHENTEIKNILEIEFPKSIKKITFDQGFNKPVDNFKLLEYVEFIYFNNSFNQPLNNIKFSDNLKLLHFTGDYTQSLHNIKVNQNILIIFSSCYINLNSINNLPNIKYLFVDDNFFRKISKISLPFTLEHIFIKRFLKDKFNLTDYKIPYNCKLHFLDENIWHRKDFDEYTYFLQNK